MLVREAPDGIPILQCTPTDLECLSSSFQGPLKVRPRAVPAPLTPLDYFRDLPVEPPADYFGHTAFLQQKKPQYPFWRLREELDSKIAFTSAGNRPLAGRTGILGAHVRLDFLVAGRGNIERSNPAPSPIGRRHREILLPRDSPVHDHPAKGWGRCELNREPRPPGWQDKQKWKYEPKTSRRRLRELEFRGPGCNSGSG